MRIEFARGDSYEQGFVLKDRSTHEPVIDDWDEVYFTVKKSFQDRSFLFQKKMTEGGIVYDGDGHYTLFILPEDTNGLAFGEYDCDIEFRSGNTKRTFAGTLKISKEVTHYYNE